MKINLSKLLLLAALLLASCSVTDEPIVVTDDKPFPYDSEIDNSVTPGDDFYKYALGQWLNSSNPSPSLTKQTNTLLLQQENSMLTNSSDPVVAQLRSQADETLVDDSKNKALLNERLQMLEQVKTIDQLYDAFKVLCDLGYSPLFRLIPAVVWGRKVIDYVSSGGMPMDMLHAFTYKDKEKVASLVYKYCQHLSGFGFSDERITQIINNALEIELLEMDAYENILETLPPIVPVSKTRVADDELDKIYHRLLSSIGIEYDDFANGEYAWSNEPVTVLFDKLSFAGDDQNEINAFRDYMIYNVMAQDAQFVPSVNKEATLVGMMKSALQYNRYYLYRQNIEYIGYDNIYKQQCTDIMERMRKTFIQRVDKLDWMSDATKAEARKKAEAMDFYIGYPDKWNDDFTPSINGDCLLASVTQLRQGAWLQINSLRRKNYSDCAWDVILSNNHANVNNAYYLTFSNSLIILPAWVMKPRFDCDLSDASLYSVAACFAHEFCHGFDSLCSGYDEFGNERDWWTPADMDAFKAKQQQMIELYNQLELVPGLYANGTMTLGENMADYGGVVLALECYKQLLKEQGFKGKQFDEQIKKFFLSYAQLWKNEIELSEKTLKTYWEFDSHSANHNRVNGMVRLQDDWYRLYDVKPTDKLYVAPADRVKIW